MIDQKSPIEEPAQSQHERPAGKTQAGAEESSASMALLDELLEEVRHMDPRQGLDRCTEGLRLAMNAGRMADVAFLLCMRGEAHFRLSDYPSAKIDAREAYEGYRSLGRLDGQAQTLLTLGGSCTQLGEYEEARGYLLDALAIAETLGSRLWIGMTFNYLGILYNQLGEYDSAITYYLRGLALQEEGGDRLGQAASLANLAWVSYESGDYQGALEYYRRCLEIFREHNDNYGISVVLNGMGDTYFKLNEYQLALQNHLESLRLAREHGDRYQESGSLNSIGKLHFHFNEFELAHANFWQSFDVKDQIGDRQGMVDVLLNIGVLYTRQNELDQAVIHLNHALALAEEIHTRPQIYQVHEALSEAYELTGDLARALEHHKQFYRARTEVMGAETDKRVQLLRSRLAIEKLEAEAELVRLKTERMEHELHLARRVQTELHPEGAPRMEPLDIASVCVPAFEAGGDYYDFFRLGERKLGIAIGDVSGKGLPAAIYMTLVKGVMKSHALPGVSPRTVLERANRMIYENFRRGWFISMIYAVIDLDAGTICYARAGHNPPLFFSGDEPVPVKPAGGMALGLAGDAIFSGSIEEVSIPFRPGDTLLLYTDGFTEAMSRDREELGDGRFLDMARRNLRHRPASEMVEGLRSDLKEFTGSAPQHDDMTLLAVRMGNIGDGETL